MIITLEDRWGEFEISCSRSVREGRVQMSIDAVAAHGCLTVRIIDQAENIVVERLVRSLPGSLAFRPLAPGKYVIEITPLRRSGKDHTKNLTWSDWEDVAGGGGAGRRLDLRDAHGAATLCVAA